MDITLTANSCTIGHSNSFAISESEIHYNYFNISSKTRPEVSEADPQRTKILQKQSNRLADIEEICNYMEIVYQHPRNVFKIFRNISHPVQEISLYQHNFSEEASQLADSQTNNKFLIICKYCTNIPGMSPKIAEMYLIQIRRYPYICPISVRK